MTELTKRQEKILDLIIRRYVQNGEPVGSQTMVDEFDLDVSSATIRNEMAALSEQGFLTQQHTSGGRIPTEKGYRFFVQRLVREFELPSDERKMIRHQFHQARLDIEQWMRLAAATLAHASTGAAIVTAPRPLVNRFKHVELISTQGRLVLMILVLAGGDVKQQMLTLAEPLSQAQLSAAASRLNQNLAGLTLEDITSRMRYVDNALEKDVHRLVIDTMERLETRHISEVYRDGLVNLLDHEGVRQAVKVLEERAFLAMLLSETLKPGVTGVQVVIGGEGRWQELKDCTIILSRYGVPEELSGAVAVFGPTRMAYGRNISMVRYVAGLMSGFVKDYYRDDSYLPSPQRNEVINSE